MISKTSFFNIGIFKTTLKRYQLGSILYFILLLLKNGISILLSTERYYGYIERNQLDSFIDNPLVLRGDYLGVSAVLTAFVPTVVAVLLFRFIHSKQTAVFTHSIPVKRSTNYISSMLAVFLLMSIPVIANGIILIILSLGGYGQFFTVASCFKWMGILLFSLFILFSCSVFAAMITGNSYAMVILNVLVHSALLFLCGSFENMASVFLYGFPDNTRIFETLATNNFFGVAVSLGNSNGFRENFTWIRASAYILISILIYALSLIMYKKRKLEYAEDVAGFKILNHIFKYSVTLLATMLAFAIFSYAIGENSAMVAFGILIISVVAYFGSEMILKKSFNIFAKSYKGYLVFVIAFVLCIALFAGTTFFGYETRLPDVNEIETVSVYNNFYNIEEPKSNKDYIKEYAVSIHNELIENNISIVPEKEIYQSRLHIKYNLKNGKELYRIYPVTYEKRDEVMTYLYKDMDYKKQCEEVFYNYTDVDTISIHPNRNRVTLYSDEISKYYASELLKVMQSDVEKLEYLELHNDEEDNTLLSIGMECKLEAGSGNVDSHRNWLSVQITPKHTNTLNWLKEKGIILE